MNTALLCPMYELPLSAETIMALTSNTQYYQFPDTTATVCCLTMLNGFAVIGQSACIDPAMFDAEVGKRMALEDAIRKAGPFLGYQVRESDYYDKLQNEAVP